MEPLATVGQLKSYLLKSVAKQWYDNERSTFEFVKLLKVLSLFSYELNFSNFVSMQFSSHQI